MRCGSKQQHCVQPTTLTGLVPDGGSSPRIRFATNMEVGRSAVALVLYCVAASLLAAYCLVRGTTATGPGGDLWPPVVWLMLLTVTTGVGPWGLVLLWAPFYPRKSWESASAGAVAMAWPAAVLVQLLVVLLYRAEAELQGCGGGDEGGSGSCAAACLADLVSLGVAILQFGLLLTAGVQHAGNWIPLPFGLGASLGLGHFLGTLVSQHLAAASGGDCGCGLVGPAAVLVLMGLVIQLPWSALRAAVLLLRVTSKRRAMTERTSSKTSKDGYTFGSSEGASPQGADSGRYGGIRSRFDSIMAEVDGLFEDFVARECVPEEELENMARVFRRIKASLLSTNLFTAVESFPQSFPDGWGYNAPENGPNKAGGSDAAFDDFKPITRSLSLDTEQQYARIFELCSTSYVPISMQNRRDNPSSSSRMPMPTMSPRSSSCSSRSYRDAPPKVMEPQLPGMLEPSASDMPKHQRTPHTLTSLLESGNYSSGHCDNPTFDNLNKLVEHMDGGGFMVGTGSSTPKEEEDDMHRDLWDSSMLGSWTFNAMQFQSQTAGHALLEAGLYFGPELMCDSGLEENRTQLAGFLSDMEQHYRHVPYHNSIHAADVLNSMMYLLQQDKVASLWPFKPVARLAGFVAAAIHDVGHFGRNNRYHIMHQHVIAVLYNDHSPLENMHCAIGFFVLQQPHAAFLQKPGRSGTFSEKDCHKTPTESEGSSGRLWLTDDELTQLRRFIIEAVLATDMSKHVEIYTRFRAAIGYCERDGADGAVSALAPIGGEQEIDRVTQALTIYLKAADMGHSAKSAEVTKEWTIRIHQEFFAQGAEELLLGMPITPLCDRSTTNIPKAQVGFLQCIVKPLFAAVYHYIPTDGIQDDVLDQLESNIARWKSSTPIVTNDLI